MGRKFQLKIALDEIPFVVQLADLTPHFDWADLFGRDAPVEVEIGSGKGLFLCNAALANPDRNYLGIERAGKYFRRAVDRIQRSKLPNIRILKADAFDILDRWVPEGSLDAVHVYFPDPWPKKRHAKRRLLQDPLFRLAARALPPGAELRIGSDVAPYFEEAVEIVAATELFDPLDWPETASDRQLTSYAIKYAEEGRSLHYAKFGRRG